MAKRGIKKNIETPEEFYDLFSQYKQWAKANPRIENVVLQKVGRVIEVKRERPITWEGFDTWLCSNGIIQDSEDYRLNTDNRYSDFKGVVSRVRKEMYEDKFTGASVNIYNSSIIARDLGLADKQQLDHTTNGQTLKPDYSNLTTEEKKSLLALLRKSKVNDD